ncbi:pectate lyase-like [Zingiber officinale]|uniref:pectate lyase-like n=1 Tax=Zingiber officinale TaxID=94328 RepID=UPI001C4BD3A4|nr:pectate lyase-like [Zingiber officinale]
MEFCLKFLSFSLLFLASATLPYGHIAFFDDFWQNRAAEARNNTLNAHVSDPETVVNSFNAAAANFPISNRTGRSLQGRGKRGGLCFATNPIDRCWRCRADWASDRKRLAQCSKGFGHAASGGVLGRMFVVTDPSDDDLMDPRPGTLRYGVTRAAPLWIVFARDMVIRLQQELMINSYKTIDGRGADVHIAYGAGLTIQFVQHVIVHNLHIHDIKPGSGGNIRDSEHHWGIRTLSDGDGINIFGASNIWIDHISMFNCADGLIDAIEASTAITISNCHLTRHNDVILLGASDSNSADAKMQVTIAYNHFGHGLVQRMPRCRWGFIHVVNNDYTHWLMYAVGGSMHPTIICQGNRFLGPPNQAAKEVTHRESAAESEWKNWNWRSEDDLYMNGAFFVQSGLDTAGGFSGHQLIKAKPGTAVGRLTRFAGVLDCRPNRPC